MGTIVSLIDECPKVGLTYVTAWRHAQRHDRGRLPAFPVKVGKRVVWLLRLGDLERWAVKYRRNHGLGPRPKKA